MQILLIQLSRMKAILFVSSVAVCMCMSSAQLVYHNDANTNSFTFSTPNAQQSFVRYFNGGGQGGPSAAALQSQQQPQPQPQPALPIQQNEIYQSRPAGAQQYYQDPSLQSYALLQQQARQQQQLALLQQQQALQQQQRAQYDPQQQSNLAVYYQQQQQQQQAQLRQERLAAAQQQQQLLQQQAQQQQYLREQEQPQAAQEQYQPQQQLPAKNLLGVNYSPSNEVSHVKYTSSGLNYNF